MHPSVEHVLKYFSYEHLPQSLQEAARPFSELAWAVAERSPDGAETVVALRKLLEAKDAAVRAALPETVAGAAERGHRGAHRAPA